MLKHSQYIVRAEVEMPFVNEVHVNTWMQDLVKEIGMTICKSGGPHVDYVNKPDNHGIAAVVMIETSHIALHVWDKQIPSLAQLDVYSCSNFNPAIVDQYMERMKPIKYESWLIDRGEGIKIIEEKTFIRPQ